MAEFKLLQIQCVRLKNIATCEEEKKQNIILTQKRKVARTLRAKALKKGLLPGRRVSYRWEEREGTVKSLNGGAVFVEWDEPVSTNGRCTSAVSPHSITLI